MPALARYLKRGIKSRTGCAKPGDFFAQGLVLCGKALAFALHRLWLVSRLAVVGFDLPDLLFAFLDGRGAALKFRVESR